MKIKGVVGSDFQKERQARWIEVEVTDKISSPIYLGLDLGFYLAGKLPTFVQETNCKLW